MNVDALSQSKGDINLAKEDVGRSRSLKPKGILKKIVSKKIENKKPAQEKLTLRSHSSASYKYNNPENPAGNYQWNSRNKSLNGRISIKDGGFYDKSTIQNNYHPKHSSSIYPRQQYHCKLCDDHESQPSLPLHQSNYKESSLPTSSREYRYENQENTVKSRNAITLRSRSPMPTRRVKRKSFQSNYTNDDPVNRNTDGRKFLYSQGTPRRSASASRSNTTRQAVTGKRNTNSYLVYAQHQAKINSKPQEIKYVKVIEQGMYVIKIFEF